MVKILMNERDVIDLLVERVAVWEENEDIKTLYELMYTDYVDGGCFDGIELDVNLIVDNDVINWCSVIEKGDEYYDEILNAYNNGERDISCNGWGWSFVEASYKGLLLVRS